MERISDIHNPKEKNNPQFIYFLFGILMEWHHFMSGLYFRKIPNYSKTGNYFFIRIHLKSLATFPDSYYLTYHL